MELVAFQCSLLSILIIHPSSEHFQRFPKLPPFLEFPTDFPNHTQLEANVHFPCIKFLDLFHSAPFSQLSREPPVTML